MAYEPVLAVRQGLLLSIISEPSFEQAHSVSQTQPFIHFTLIALHICGIQMYL